MYNPQCFLFFFFLRPAAAATVVIAAAADEPAALGAANISTNATSANALAEASSASSSSPASQASPICVTPEAAATVAAARRPKPPDDAAAAAAMRLHASPNPTPIAQISSQMHLVRDCWPDSSQICSRFFRNWLSGALVRACFPADVQRSFCSVFSSCTSAYVAVRSGFSRSSTCFSRDSTPPASPVLDRLSSGACTPHDVLGALVNAHVLTAQLAQEQTTSIAANRNKLIADLGFPDHHGDNLL